MKIISFPDKKAKNTQAHVKKKKNSKISVSPHSSTKLLQNKIHTGWIVMVIF